MYLNIDINSVTTPFFDKVVREGAVTADKVAAFMDAYKAASVTDVLFCVFCQIAGYDSAVFTDYADKYEQKTENGEAVDYRGRYAGLYALHKTYGLDPYAIWIDRTRKMGKKAWVSVRMNDCHFNFQKTSFLRSNFFYEAKANGWTVGDKYGYFGNCFDYAFPQVREKMLSLIEEVLAVYDADGLELDFMREIFCFDCQSADHGEIVRIMRGFLRDVRALVDKAAEKRGHAILLGLRVGRDVEQCERYGFDLTALDGLIDVVVPSPRWSQSDNQIPIAEWKRALPHTLILGCIDTLASEQHGAQAHMTAALTRGSAILFLAQGADDIYLYNYFRELDAARDEEIYATCGSYAEAVKHPARFALIGEERGMNPAPTPLADPLPIKVEADERVVAFPVGDAYAGRNARLILGFLKGSPADVAVTVGGKRVTGFVPCPVPAPAAAMEAGSVCYEAAIVLAEGVQAVGFASCGDEAVISWVEIDG